MSERVREKHLTSMCHSNENVDAPNELNSYRVFTSQHASYMILNASHFTNQKAKMSREREREKGGFFIAHFYSECHKNDATK